MAAAVGTRSNLKKLNVTDCGFTISGGYNLIQNLGRNHTIKYACLDHNNLGGIRIKLRVLKDLLFNNQTIETLSMCHCLLGENGGSYISRGLGHSPSLTHLFLGYNEFTDEGVSTFNRAFEEDTIQL